MVKEKINNLMKENELSGAFLYKEKSLVLEGCNGYANRAEQRLIQMNTRFGIASGCKLFTAIAICQLVEQGKLPFNTKLQDCLTIELPHFDQAITIHHLLTHTAGIPDYFDEEVMDDFEELWIAQPMYLMRNLSDFLPLFQNHPMKLAVGERFHYNNAGYILLGLVVEQVSGKGFDVYVTENIFKRAEMEQSGYFELDALPRNTALGYIDEEDGSWKSNIYSVPVKGGADGGAFVTVDDMHHFWQALMKFELLNPEVAQQLLTPYIHTDDDYDRFYGYGVWIDKRDDIISKYHVMGYDPGVSFHSAFYPENGVTSVVCSNKSEGAFDVFKELEKL